MLLFIEDQNQSFIKKSTEKKYILSMDSIQKEGSFFIASFLLEQDLKNKENVFFGIDFQFISDVYDIDYCFVSTIKSNIVGFTNLYEAKDKLGVPPEEKLYNLPFDNNDDSFNLFLSYYGFDNLLKLFNEKNSFDLIYNELIFWCKNIKRKPFDLNLAISGIKVETKDGRKVTDIKIINSKGAKTKTEAFKNNNFIQAVSGIVHSNINDQASESICYFYNDGTNDKYCESSNTDLVMKKEDPSKFLPFNLELALNGKEIRTKDGRKVTNFKIINKNARLTIADAIFHDDYVQGVTAVIHNVSGQHTHFFYHDGTSHKYGLDTDCDLVIIPE